MSMTYIRHHNENIKDIEAYIRPEEVTRNVKYQSKFKKNAVEFHHKKKVTKQEKGKQLIYEAKKEERRTMGYARKENWLVPSAFLRKKEGVTFQKVSDHKCYRRYVPIVPRLSVLKEKDPQKKTEKETCEVEKPKPKRNFIKKNIDKIKGAKGAIREPRYVDKEDGRPRLLLPSGLVPVHSCLPSFGKKPCYLDARRKLLKKIAVECKTRQEDEIEFCKGMVKHGTREITRDELLELKRGLQNNWDYTTHLYMKFSLYTDTEGKKVRKRALESTLNQIETYMSMIENNTALFVSDLY